MERLLTVKEVADRLKLKPGTIYLWMQQRKITYLKIGGAIRFNERHIEGYAESRVIKKVS